jgi:membrane protein YqaA with SNARE-associated domain
MFRKLYEWVLHWANTPYGTPALAILSFVESSFFPVPPDPLLVALSMGNTKKSFYYALVCSTMSVAGGVFGYYIGLYLWQTVSGFFFTYVFTTEAFNYVSQKYQENGFLAILGAAMTPIPYKVFTVSAGVFKLDLTTFIAGSVIGRSSRFFLEAVLVYLFGEKIKKFIDKYFQILVTLFFILIAIGFFLFKYILAK